MHRVRCPERARVIIKPWKPFSRPFFFCEVPREGFDYLRCCGGVRTFTPNVDAQGGLEALFFIQPIGELLEDFPSLVYSEADREYAIPRRLEELPHDNARIPCSFRRVAASHRVNQLLQRLLDARLRLLDARSSGARTANSTALSAARFQLPVPLVNRRARQSRRVRNQSIASVSDGTRDSVAAQIRRPGSSRYGSTTAYFSTIVASSSTLRLIGGVKHNTNQMQR